MGLLYGKNTMLLQDKVGFNVLTHGPKFTIKRLLATNLAFDFVNILGLFVNFYD